MSAPVPVVLRKSRNTAILSALALLQLSLLSCATNPVTGKKEFNLVSEKDELAMGAEGNADVIRQFGIYDEKPELNQLVDRLGRRIAAVSDRPNLEWHFALLDSPMVNAMALPGGYVYVTRGIVERMSSEDELAGVIAHEISHVAARHSARSMSQQQLAQIGLAIGSIVAGPAATQAYGSLVQLGAGLLFTRYSRQQETQADLLGTAYMTEAGFNPRGAENMLLALERLENGKEGGIDRYFVDHPDPRKRVSDVKKEIGSLQAKNAAIGTQPLDRAPFVKRLDGIITGASTLDTTIVGNRAYNRRYGIIVTAPPGWDVTTEPGTLFILSPRKGNGGEGMMIQEVPLQKMQGADNAQAAVRNNLQQMGLQYVRSGGVSTATGQRFDVDVWAGQTNSGTVQVESTQLIEGDNALVFLQFGPAGSANDLGRTLQSLRFDRAAARAVEPPRIHVGPARKGDTWEEVAGRATGNRSDAEAVAKLNGFDFPSLVSPGILLKLPRDIIRRVEQ